MKKRAAQKERTETRDAPPLQLRAEVKLDSFDVEARTVDVVFSTGARVRRGFWEPFDEELSLEPAAVRMGRLNSGRAPVLDSHASWGGVGGVLGVVQSASVDGKRGIATLRFAKPADDPEADKVFRKIGDGIIANVSVGYRVHKMVKVEDGSNQVPVMRVVDWEPMEISPCPIGADAGAGFRAERVESNRCEVVTRSEQPEDNAMTEAEIAAAALAEKARADATKNGIDVAARAATEAATTAERTRAEGVGAILRSVKLDSSDPKFTADLLAKNPSIEEARKLVLDKLATATDAVRTDGHVTITDDAADKFARAQVAWLIAKAGLSDLVARAKKDAPEKFADVVLDPGQFRGFSLVDLARASLERSGFKGAHGEKMQMVGKALTQRVSGAHSISDFPIILEQALHKILLAAFQTAPDTWNRFCKTGSVSDFRAHNRYRLGSLSVLDTVLEGGEFKRKTLPDATKTSITASTKGNLIALTRQAIINDDMGAFASFAQMLGRAAKLSIEAAVYALLAENGGLGPLLADGFALFDAAHANIGAPAAISVESIDGDRVLMASQLDQDGNEFLDLRPVILLVPIGLGGTARVINQAQFDPDTANKLQRPNKVVGLYSTIVDTPRISGTRRYSFADPNIAPAIEVAFLDGMQEPFMENRLGWTIDGTEWKVRLDFGVAAVEHKGAVTNAGV
jgi:hypothetical protein